VEVTDREKVIKELECCVSLNHNGSKCANCDYADEFRNGDCETYLLSDALALLKAQEPDEDWISRKRLRDEIQYYIEEAGWGDEVNKVLGWCLEFIDNQDKVKWE